MINMAGTGFIRPRKCSGYSIYCMQQIFVIYLIYELYQVSDRQKNLLLTDCYEQEHKWHSSTGNTVRSSFLVVSSTTKYRFGRQNSPCVNTC